MHPILLHRRWLFIYVAVWAGLAVIPTLLLGHGAALLVCLPQTLGLGAALLPLWYVCAALPLRPSDVTRIVTAHAVLLAFWSSVWLLGGELLAHVAAIVVQPALPAWFAQQRAALLAIAAVFYLLAMTFNYLLLGAAAARAAQQRETALILQAREAQLSILSAQVHPHFLFNSLHTISALVTQNPAQARDMCVQMADFLRQSMRLGQQRTAPLHAELALADAYLQVEAIRLGARLQVAQDIAPESRHCVIPTLMLQPLVENAITHGIASCDAGGTLSIRTFCDGDRLHIVLTNPFDAMARPRHARTGLGLPTCSAVWRCTTGVRRCSNTSGWQTTFASALWSRYMGQTVRRAHEFWVAGSHCR